MLDLRLQADVLASCLCNPDLGDQSCDPTRPIDKFDLDRVWPIAGHLQSGLNEYIYVRKTPGCRASKNTVTHDAWYFDVSEGPAARWMQLSGFIEEGKVKHKPASYVLTRHNYCRECAYSLVPTDGNDLVMVLLR